MKFKRKQSGTALAARSQLRGGKRAPFRLENQYVPLSRGEMQLYRSLRQSLPILDAAIDKLVRLTGGFSVSCPVPAAERQLQNFLDTVPCGRGQQGIGSFLTSYLDSLLTYGRAVGEMVVSGGQLRAVLWGDVAQIQVQEGASPLDYTICGPDENGVMQPLPFQNLLLFTTLHPEPENPYGVSLLRSMPFLADILLKIYTTIGTNWERAGNVRYAVVCKPGSDAMDAMSAGERAEQIAQQWSHAMQDTVDGTVRDFVAVGDVSIRVIGEGSPILDAEVPVRQLLEQLVAKTGLPPFMLGLSWASTERMSTQQADMLTSELWSYRRAVTPVLRQICQMWLRLNGYGCKPEIVWEDISLQDLVEEAKAAYYNAQTEVLCSQMEKTPKEEI